jgi:hypothetical protein
MRRSAARVGDKRNGGEVELDALNLYTIAKVTALRSSGLKMAITQSNAVGGPDAAPISHTGRTCARSLKPVPWASISAFANTHYSQECRRTGRVS